MPSSSTLARPDSWGKLILIFLIWSHLHCPLLYLHVRAVLPGSWELLVENGGVSAMHMTLTYLNTVIIYDRTDYGPSEIKLPDGRCRHDPRDMALKVDCYAHSVELDLSTNSVRPLEVLTDTWCSSASFLADGTLVSTGGWNDGSNVVRMLVPCNDNRCDWNERPDRLGASRWYASNHILPDNTVIVVGGRRSFSYEFVPTGTTFSLPFLYETNEPSSENNLYPFLHLSSDGNLFVFANSKSILLDYKTNRVVRKFPELPGGGSRNYPSSGSSVVLPLSASDGFRRVEVMVCGGAPHGAWQQVAKMAYPQALATCGRMVITDADPEWSMEEMPSGRVMSDMLILPTSEILIINGAKQGTAGWGCAVNPSLSPFLYNPSGPTSSGSRFRVLAASTIPRMYHSSAILLPDGRVLVGGSNTNEGYTFSDVPFPTELRIEAFRPYYLDPSFDAQRPRIVAVSPVEIGYGALFEVDFTVGDEGSSGSNDTVEFKVYAPSFSTHSTQMNQRQLLLEPVSVSVSVSARNGSFIVWRAVVKAPPSAIAAPSGYYLLYVVVNAAVPSTGSWVRISPGAFA